MENTQIMIRDPWNLIDEPARQTYHDVNNKLHWVWEKENEDNLLKDKVDKTLVANNRKRKENNGDMDDLDSKCRKRRNFMNEQSIWTAEE